MKYIKIAALLTLALSSAAFGIGYGQVHNQMETQLRLLNQDVEELSKLITHNQQAADHFKAHQQHGIADQLEQQITLLDNYRVQLKQEITAAHEHGGTATNIDSTTATVEKKSCHTCNKPKKACVVREKKACTPCKLKAERPKKECHTCNKYPRPVQPKAAKCGSCHHTVAQEIDQENITVIEAIAEPADGENDEAVTVDTITVDQPKKACGACKPKCTAQPKCAKPEIEKIVVEEQETEVIEDSAV